VLPHASRRGGLFRAVQWTTLVILIAAIVVLQVARDRWYPPPGEDADPVLYMQSTSLAKRVAGPYAALAADLDWIRAVQHYGRDHASDRSKKYQLLYPLLDRATSLDPLFNIAYRFGAIFLADPYPRGAGRADQAIALLKKGIEAQPRKWEYFEDIGFVYYWQLHDYKAAAEWFDRAGAIPGAPWWMRSMAAVTLAKGGDRASSRTLWQQLSESTDNDWIQGQAILRLRQLDAMDQIDQLEAVVRRYRMDNGRSAESWPDLVRAGLLRGLPVDPSGAAYDLDARTGNVSVSRNSGLYPMPDAMPAESPVP
jgi:hypothetical protein